jgi:hypothetical protein
MPIGTLIAKSHGDGQRADADRDAEVARRKDGAQQCRGDAHDAGPADGLQHARKDQNEQRGRQRAGERADREEHDAGCIHAAISYRISERGKRQQQHRDDDLIGVDDPDGTGRVGVQFASDRGQRHVGDRAVEDGHDRADDDDRHGQAPRFER